MIDIHCHILPGIDDGPRDLATSMEMLRIASEDGITHIAATPHFVYNEKPSARDIYERLIMLRESVSGTKSEIRLMPGADIKLTYELIFGLEKNDIPTINGSRYFLLELPDLMPLNLDNFVFESTLKGFIPIITHPERNYSLLASPGKTDELRNAGALFQLTAMSVTGEFGSQIKKFSHMLLKKNMVDFIATDAHNTDRRVPVLSKAYREIAGLFNEYEAERLFLNNPLAVIENREIRMK